MSSSELAAEDEATVGLLDGKRRSRRFCAVNSVVSYAEVHEEELGEQEDVDGEHPVAKKPRKQIQKKADFKIPFDDLCGGIIQVIYSMLKDPRDLFNLSQCSIRLRSLVTYDHVIRAAVFHGNQQSASTIRHIVQSVQQQVIFVPTVQRFLRLVNGTCCERGKNFSFERELSLMESIPS